MLETQFMKGYITKEKVANKTFAICSVMLSLKLSLTNKLNIK